MRGFDKLLMQTVDESSGHMYLYCLDVRTGWSRWSKNAVEEFGLPGEFLHNMGEIWATHIHPEDRLPYEMDLEETLSGKRKRHCCQYRAKNKWGIYNWLQCEGTVSFDENGQAEKFAGYMFNLGPKNKYDTLTKLQTIHVFQEVVEQVLEKQGSSGYLMVVGIDDFTRINDLYTFTVGDRILHAFAQELQEACATGPQLFRLDGDKFGILYEGASEEQVEELYRQLQKRGVGLRLSDFSQNLPVNISAGAVKYEGGTVSVDVLHRNASYSMELAKENGKNRLVFFSDDTLQQSLHQLMLLKRLQECVSAGFEGFYLVYQPIINGRDNHIEGCEVLLRWKDEEFGQPGPMEFIPLLESSGLIDKVGLWLVREALTQLVKWQRISKDFAMSINISYKQFKNPEFKPEVIRLLEEVKVKRNSVILELTESCKVEKMDSLRRELEEFRESGVLIALDDFGTGYASISVLREVPADIVKIDHSFVRKIEDNVTDKAILKHLIEMCQSVGIQVCVEGIETQEIYSIVWEYHPDFYQGYYYSRPLPAAEFAERFV